MFRWFIVVPLLIILFNYPAFGYQLHTDHFCTLTIKTFQKSNRQTYVSEGRLFCTCRFPSLGLAHFDGLILDNFPHEWVKDTHSMITFVCNNKIKNTIY